jgi:hypothetical protein
VNHLVFLLEELSAKDLLKGLLPKIIPVDTEVYYLVFEGKQDLEGQIVKKLKGWQRPDPTFIILRDQDAADCLHVKAKLRELVERSERVPVMVRVACRELESWIAGDWRAIACAFDRPQLASQSTKAVHRNPDQLMKPIDAIRRLLPEYQKRDGARRVGPLLDPGRNQSPSFRVFCSGLSALIAGFSQSSPPDISV